jgi:hypothetical protein
LINGDSQSNRCTPIGDAMKTTVETARRKRHVNLTLSEDLVSEAKSLTDNLSGVGSLSDESQLNVAALDELLTGAWN